MAATQSSPETPAPKEHMADYELSLYVPHLPVPLSRHQDQSWWSSKGDHREQSAHRRTKRLAAPHLPTSQPHTRAGSDPGGFNAGDPLLDFQRGGSEHIYRPVPVLTRQQYKPRMDRGRQGETERAYFHKLPSKQWRSSSRCFCISFLCFLLFLPSSCRIRCRRGETASKLTKRGPRRAETVFSDSSLSHW